MPARRWRGNRSTGTSSLTPKCEDAAGPAMPGRNAAAPAVPECAEMRYAWRPTGRSNGRAELRKRHAPHPPRGLDGRARLRGDRRRWPRRRPNAGAILQGQADRARHRLSAGRQQRRLRAAPRAPSRQAHPRQSDRGAAEPARRRLVPDACLCLRRRAEGRLGDRHRRADRAARREARHPGRALQDRRAELDRPHRLADQHGVHSGTPRR